MTCSENGFYEKFPFDMHISSRVQRVGVYRFEGSCQTHSIVLALPRSSLDAVINLRSDSQFVPKTLGLNDDPRRLSVAFFDFKLGLP